MVRCSCRRTARELFAAPRHPYTAGLLRSVPSFTEVGAARPDGDERGRLQEIPGMVPPLTALPAGCKFQDRCPAVQERCRTEEPALEAPRLPTGGAETSRLVRCHFPVMSEAAA